MTPRLGRPNTDTGLNQPDVDTTTYRDMERAVFVSACDPPCRIRV